MEYEIPHYSFLSRFFHQIVLNGELCGRAAFEWEKRAFGSASAFSGEKHVFISGLARSGTTIILRHLHSSGEFCSLTYRDMPFVMAPNTWGRISNFYVKENKARQRIHGDGLAVDYESPEAFEEVFWRTLYGSAYIRQDCLVPMGADIAVRDDFRTFVSLVLRSKRGCRYLSKNNNNILRLQKIAEAFPEAAVLIPFRHPLQQSYSLRAQHRRFLSLSAKEPFIDNYMSYLGHYEFGRNHRPFRFEEREEADNKQDKLDYWVEIWCETYDYILEQLPAQAILIGYEFLCDNGQRAFNVIQKILGLKETKVKAQFQKSVHEINEPLPKELYNRAIQLYRQLEERSVR